MRPSAVSSLQQTGSIIILGNEEGSVTHFHSSLSPSQTLKSVHLHEVPPVNFSGKLNPVRMFGITSILLSTEGLKLSPFTLSPAFH